MPNLIRYMRIRAKYNAIATDKNPYLKKGWKPNKTTVRVGILYMIVLLATLTALVRLEQPVLLAVIPAALWLGVMVFFAILPDEHVSPEPGASGDLHAGDVAHARHLHHACSSTAWPGSACW